MADDEAKDVPSTNEQVAETGPQEVPDQNLIQNEETGISESNAADGTEISQTEEGQSVEPPANVQEPISPATTERAEVKDGSVSDAEVTIAGEDAVKDEEKSEATEETKTDEVQDETSEAKHEDVEKSHEQLLDANDEDDKLSGGEGAGGEEEEVSIEKETERSQVKKDMSVRWQDTAATSEEHKTVAKERKGVDGDHDKTDTTQTKKGHKKDRPHDKDLSEISGDNEKYADFNTIMETPEGFLHPDTPSQEQVQEEDMEETEENGDDDATNTDSSVGRTKLIEQYQQYIVVRDQLQQQNAQIQQKLAEFFKKKKPDDSRTDKDAKNVADLEQRYLKLMAQIEELQEKQETEKNAQIQRTEELEHQCAEKKQRVNTDQRKLQDMKRQVAQHAINSRSGKPIPDTDIDQYLANESKKDAELENVRLENIKLKNKLKKKELQLKSKEELAEGLHLIDFEQLKIENQTYNEKIEERNEELQKLRKKIKSTVEVQTHMKEKLQFVEVENEVLYKELQEIEAQVTKKRDKLSRTKQMRDALKRSNTDLHKNCGLLGNQLLLRNFEDQKDENARLLQQLEDLKMTFAEYTMQSKQVQQKINQATKHIGFWQK